MEMDVKITNFTNIELDIDVRGYTADDGTVYVNLQDVCKGLGFTFNETKFSATSGRKSTYETIRWNRVLNYIKALRYTYDPINIKRDDFYVPERVFYGLAMKAKNETAVKFQSWLAEEVIPSIRRTGAFMNTKYDQVRAMSVYSRKLETSSIGKFIRYCKDTKYPVKKTALYTELSTMVNALAKISNGKRDEASAHQLAVIIFAELSIRDIIENGIGEKMPADDIKGAVWDWILEFNEYLNKSDNPDDLMHKLKLKKFSLIK